MTTQPPKPLSRSSVLRSLKIWERNSENVSTVSDGFSDCVKEIYDLHDINEKQLLALHQKFSKNRRRNSVVLVHLEIK